MTEAEPYVVFSTQPLITIKLFLQGLIELVQSLQDAMVVEQQTFDTLTLQLEDTRDAVLQQRLSAALCTSQTRLARLCSRNMRCFTQVCTVLYTFYFVFVNYVAFFFLSIFRLLMQFEMPFFR